ncbi:hypothetical protein [Flavobacterium capsici]|uniref:Lipoprotein n=1 Tax=Flavobacterium capsici TaxID=3075618 RepID=A0AA96F3A3_9FLAO|nr:MULTISPECIES: hypothetical protein [unclassified Flavobacterium]WNM19202.1 hypothetical protein RN608_00625 [Flavobacterium sp. PMR2A8]WNM20591.1 hypothetical protein RN605_07795 [Flavobacterium sp. PMTSA4]
MKIKNLVLGLALSMFILSCSKDDSSSNDNTLNAAQARTSAEIDNMTEDVSAIVENQIDIQLNDTGRMSDAPESFLPPCATVTTVVTGNTWTRTIDFGTTGCTMPNGNVLSGMIIITKTVNSDPLTRTFSVTFDNFHFNARLVEGNKTIVRTLTTVAPIHPTSTMTLNLTVTFPNGDSFVRTGNRVSEMIEGFGTPIWADNIFRVTGNWSTTRPNWSQTTTITTPLVFRMNCQYRLVRGVLEIVRNNNTAVINYGDGTCDNEATISINGGPANTFTFGN